jgi:lysophospholipase L1-like esterase
MRMTRLYSGFLIACAVAAGSLAACSGSSSSPPTAAAKQTLYVGYTAIGASDAVGYGASVPCTEASPALVADPTCPETGASGYVPDIRTDIAQYGFVASLQDLGISGAVIGPDIETTANMYDPTTCGPRSPADAYPGNFLVNELPSVNPSALFVTIFAGGNDVNGIVTALVCGAGGATTASQTAFVTQEIEEFGADFATLVGTVHATAPKATIIVANIPNFANVPYAFALSTNPQLDLEVRTALQEVSVAIDTDVINTLPAKGIPVVDLQCNPASYNPSNFYTDGFHPNDAGYAALAAQYVQQLLSNSPAAPASSCAYQGLASAPGVTPTSARVRSIDVPFSVGTRLNMPLR